MPSECNSERKSTKSCRLRPSRSTDHAITKSNSRRVAARQSADDFGLVARRHRSALAEVDRFATGLESPQLQNERGHVRKFRGDDPDNSVPNGTAVAACKFRKTTRRSIQLPPACLFGL